MAGISRRPSAEITESHTEQAPPAEMNVLEARSRATDTDRETTVERLRVAFGRTEITRPEFDARVKRAMCAVTLSDLTMVTRDLQEYVPPPPAVPAQRATPKQALRQVVSSERMAPVWIAQLWALSVGLPIWGLVSAPQSVWSNDTQAGWVSLIIVLILAGMCGLVASSAATFVWLRDLK